MVTSGNFFTNFGNSFCLHKCTIRKNLKPFWLKVTKKRGNGCKLDTLDEGDVLIKVSYSSFNYKDGLAISGKTPILKNFQ